MWGTLITDLKAILTALEGQAATAFAFLMSFFKEAISEEEAALFPVFQTQAIQIFNDAVKTAGLTVEQRVALVVTEALADLAADIVIARTALYNSWAWAIAHQQGIINGNQGVLTDGSTGPTTT